MKHTWLLTVFIIWVLNLFLLGIMIGRAYQHGPIQDEFYQGQNLSVMGKVKFFASGITSASKRVLSRLDDKCLAIIDYAKHPSKLVLIRKIVFPNKKNQVGVEKTQTLIIAESGKESNNNATISHLEANIPFAPDNYFEDLPHKLARGRLDPFLNIVPQPKALQPQPVKNRPISKIDDKKELDLQIGQKDEPQKINPLSKLSLRGIIVGKNRVAYIEDQRGYQKVTIGTSIAGGKVIDITKEAVTIQIGTQQITLTEEGSKY